jgi:hypothetical protein
VRDPREGQRILAAITELEQLLRADGTPEGYCATLLLMLEEDLSRYRQHPMRMPLMSRWHLAWYIRIFSAKHGAEDVARARQLFKEMRRDLYERVWVAHGEVLRRLWELRRLRYWESPEPWDEAAGRRLQEYWQEVCEERDDAGERVTDSPQVPMKKLFGLWGIAE